MDEIDEPEPLDKPRFRVNAKQTSKGLFYIDITVELREATAEWEIDGVRSQVGVGVIWGDLLRQVRKQIREAGGRLAEEEPAGKP